MRDRSDRDARVIKVIENSGDEGVSSFGIYQATKLWMGTLYPILTQLERKKKIRHTRIVEGGHPRYIYRV